MMRADKTYIGWLLSGMLMLFLTACASHEDPEDAPKEKAVLKIHVSAPDRSIVTRGDNGNVDATEAENAVHNLHLWVFEHANGKFVGHVSSGTGSELSTGQGIFSMEVSDDFAKRQPKVDVYVMANVTNENCGISLGATSTRDDLDNALIGISYFGLTSPVSSVPTGGLPMTGVLKEQSILDNAPVFGVGSETTQTHNNVKLVRAVSKVQFVFTAIDDIDETHKHTVESITLNAEMIPTTEYLFLKDAYSAEGGGNPLTFDGYRYKVGSSYNESAATLMNTQKEINKCAITSSPDDYVYKTQTGQAYETLIQTGITNGDLTSAGTFYLRESDKNVEGTITYDANKTAKFQLVKPEEDFVPGDFGRNHTWIVYGYFTENLNIMTVYIKVKEWEDKDPLDHIIYNW